MLNFKDVAGVVEGVFFKAINYALAHDDSLDRTERLILFAIMGTSDIQVVAELMVKKYPDEKIKAIKALREATGIGLKEGKDEIEAAMERLGFSR